MMFNGKFPFPPSREAWEISLPGISRTGIPGNFPRLGNSPLFENFPSLGKFPNHGKFLGIPVREIPGREISQASWEGGNGNFPLNINALKLPPGQEIATTKKLSPVIPPPPLHAFADPKVKYFPTHFLWVRKQYTEYV